MSKKNQLSGESKGDVVIYKDSTGSGIQVKLEKDTVWLDAHLIAKIFDVRRPAIVKHISKIYKTGELNERSTCSILEQVAATRGGNHETRQIYNKIAAGNRQCARDC